MKTRTPAVALTLFLALVLALAPVAAFAAPPAQDGGVDDAAINALIDASKYVYSAGGTGGTPSTTPVVDTDDETGDDVIDVEIGELVPHASQGITLYLPDNWQVDTGDFDTLFSVEEQDTGLSLQFETFGEDVPGLFMIPVFESILPMFVESLGMGASLGETEHVQINDTVPALRVPFYNAANSFIGTMDGTIYIIAAGDKGYGVYAGSLTETWPALEAVVDEAIQGMEIDPELITLQQAGDEPLQLYDVDGTYSVQLPAGWYGSYTGDEDLGLVFSDPAISFVGAGGLSPTTDSNDPMLRTLIEATAGALDEETSQLIIQSILEEMDLAGDGDVFIDESQSMVFPAAANGMMGIVRVVGEAPIEDDIILPVVLYLSVYLDRAGAFIFMGNTDAVQENEETILQVIESLVVEE